MTDPGPHEWQRLMRGWHLVFAALAAVTVVLLLVDSGFGPTRRLVGVALVVVLCGWYAMTGAGALRREPHRRGVAYLVVAMPATIGLFAVAPVGAVMLFMLYPHIWALMPTRWAVAGTTVAVALTAGVMLAWTGLGLERLGYVAAAEAVALLVAIALGLWITRVIEQSRRRAELVAELDATRAELARMSHRGGVLAERDRLAREIHDTLAQGFASVLMQLEVAQAQIGRDERAVRERIDRARCTARESLAEARALVAALTPPQLRERSLVAALAQVVAQTRPELPGGTTLVVRGTPRALPPGHEVVMLRALQEALANVRKHAVARHVEVRLEYDDQPRATLRVIDDGRGFDPDDPAPGFGLEGLRRRVGQVGGSVTVRAAPGAGVALSVELRG